jgi:hypothetical protein
MMFGKLVLDYGRVWFLLELYPDTKIFGDLTILTNHFKQPKLV